MINILVIDDNEPMMMGISFSLESQGYNIFNASTLKDAKKIINNEIIDLILLDVDLPDGNGIVFCKKIKQEFTNPIIFIAASSEEVNIVNALNNGGDDYIVKPFTISVLLARINAVLRRRNMRKNNMLKSNSIVLWNDSMKVQKDGIDVILNKRQLELLILFMHNPKRILTKEQIIEVIWGTEGEFVDDNVVAVNIRRLREKVEEEPSKPAYIKTIRGLGYMWMQGCEYK